jgi:hypothetical protein
MIHAFMLVVLLNGAQLRSEPMYFIDIDRCLYFAERLQKQKNFSAYCKPAYVQQGPTVYR